MHLADSPRSKSAPGRAEAPATPPRRARQCPVLHALRGLRAARTERVALVARAGSRSPGAEGLQASKHADAPGPNPHGTDPSLGWGPRLVVDEMAQRSRSSAQRVRARARLGVRDRALDGRASGPEAAASPRARCELASAVTWAGVLLDPVEEPGLGSGPGSGTGPWGVLHSRLAANTSAARLRMCDSDPFPRRTGAGQELWGGAVSSGSGSSLGGGSHKALPLASVRFALDADAPTPPHTPPRLTELPPERPVDNGVALPMSPRKAPWRQEAVQAAADVAAGSLQPSPFEAPPPPAHAVPAPVAVAPSPFERARLVEPPFSPPKSASRMLASPDYWEASGQASVGAVAGVGSTPSGLVGSMTGGGQQQEPASAALGRGQHAFLATLRQQDAQARQRSWRSSFASAPGGAVLSGGAASGYTVAAKGGFGQGALGGSALLAGASLGGLSALSVRLHVREGAGALFGSSSVTGMRVARNAAGLAAGIPIGFPGLLGAASSFGGALLATPEPALPTRLKPTKPSEEELGARRRELRLDVLRRGALGAPSPRGALSPGLTPGSTPSNSLSAGSMSVGSGSSAGSGARCRKLGRSAPPEPADSFFGDVGVSLSGAVDADAWVTRPSALPGAPSPPLSPASVAAGGTPAGAQAGSAPVQKCTPGNGPPAWALPAGLRVSAAAPAAALADGRSHCFPGGSLPKREARMPLDVAQWAGAVSTRQFGTLELEGRAFMEAAGLSADALLSDVLAMGDSGVVYA